jgi:hypothetical protein
VVGFWDGKRRAFPTFHFARRREFAGFKNAQQISWRDRFSPV